VSKKAAAAGDDNATAQAASFQAGGENFSQNENRAVQSAVHSGLGVDSR
jgi:hypothetical protein